MGLLKSPLDRAQDDIKRVSEARSTLHVRLEVAREQLAQLRTELPDLQIQSLLGEVPIGKPADAKERTAQMENIRRRIRDLETEISNAPEIERRLIEKLKTAIRARNSGQATKIRQEADQLEAERQRHMQKVNELLAGLQALEGIPYVAGVALDQNGQPRLIAPNSQAMQFQVERLRLQAANIEQAPITVRGAVTGYSLQELLDALKDNPLSPTRAAVEAWFRESELQAEAEFLDQFPGGQFRADGMYCTGEERPVDRETNYSLHWDDQLNIDTAASGFRNSAHVRTAAAAAMPQEAVAS